MIHTSEATEAAEMMEFIYTHSNFPRLSEFLKNPDKWRNNEEDIFQSLAQMNVFFKDRVASVSYYWHGKYKCKSIEELQNRARSEGYLGSDLEYSPVAKPTHGTSNLHNSKVDVIVNIYTKLEFKLLGGIVSNG